MEIEARLSQIEEALRILERAVLQLQREMMRRLIEDGHG